MQLDKPTRLFIGVVFDWVAQASIFAKLTKGMLTDDSVSSDEEKRTAEQIKWNERCIFIPD